MHRRTIIIAAIIAVVAGAGIYLWERSGSAPAGKMAGGPGGPGGFAMPVPVTPVVKKTIPIHLDYSARTESIRNITLQAKISGYVQKQHVADGADVKEGDPLYTIDPRDYQVALDQAKAQAQRDTAALDYARSNLGRGDTLAKGGWIAKDALDQRSSTARQAEAALAADDATIRSAEINLGYTEIRAPFSGRLGRNQASVGTFIGVGGAALNTLVQLNPIYVTFNPSEAQLVEIQNARARGKVEAEVMLPGETEPRHKGELTFLDNSVERTTGTIAARATIDNPNLTLLPGQYVRIRLKIGDQPNALMVPQTALGSSQLGKYVYVVGADNKAEQRLVSLGPIDGNLVAVLQGVGENDQIINGNLQKIGPGSPVQPIQKQVSSN